MTLTTQIQRGRHRNFLKRLLPERIGRRDATECYTEAALTMLNIAEHCSEQLVAMALAILRRAQRAQAQQSDQSKRAEHVAGLRVLEPNRDRGTCEVPQRTALTM